MEFQKERCYSALNADELRAGDKVIVAYNLYGLKEQVKMFTESAIDVIEVIQDEDYFNRFKVKHGESFPLAYLVERAENCTNCGASPCGYRVNHDIEDNKINKCPLWFQPKTEQKAEKCEDCKKAYTDYPCVANVYHDATGRACENFEAEKKYRPFKDTDELIKVWGEKGGKWQKRELTMPLIWVRDPKRPKCTYLLNGLIGNEVHLGSYIFNMQELFDNFELLDGSVCGVEE